MDLLFFVGEAEGCPTKLRLEATQHDDVRQLPVPDRYSELPKKTLALMSVAAEHSPPVDFLVKIDDDVVLDAPWLSGARALSTWTLGSVPPRQHCLASSWASILADRVLSIPEHDVRVGIYWGFFHNDSVPDRDPSSKWYDAAYTAAAFPPYAAGPCYILSQPALHFLAEAANQGMLRTDWKNEDVSVGSWLHGTRIVRGQDLPYGISLSLSLTPTVERMKRVKGVGCMQQFRHDDGMVRFLEAEPADWTRPPFALHLQSYDADQSPRRLASSAKAREQRVMEAVQATMARLHREELLVGRCCDSGQDVVDASMA